MIFVIISKQHEIIFEFFEKFSINLWFFVRSSNCLNCNDHLEGTERFR